jgi:hypothetical protein
MASKRDVGETLAAKWERQAHDSERATDRADSDYNPIEKRLMRAQANVYRACAAELRIETRKLTNG